MLSQTRISVSSSLLVVWVCLGAAGQDVPTGWVLTHPDQEIRVAPLRSTTSGSTSATDVLVASVEVAVMDPAVCCGKKSALEDEAALTETTPLKELGRKLRGKHYLDSGEAITVVDQYWAATSVNAESIIGCLAHQHALLMEWDKHIYVMYGAVFDEYDYSSGSVTDVIKKLLLLDMRFSGTRRYTAFDRQTDDWSKVNGLLAFSVTR